MINEQLIDYIRQQLQARIPKEVIQQTLSEQGNWTSEDVREAFGVIEQGTPTKSAIPAYGALTTGIVSLVVWILLDNILSPESLLVLAWGFAAVCAAGVFLAIKSFKRKKVVASIAIIICLIIIANSISVTATLYSQGYIVPKTYSDSQVSFRVPKQWIQKSLSDVEQPIFFILRNGDAFTPRLTYYCSAGVPEGLTTVGETWTQEMSKKEGSTIIVHSIQHMGGQDVYVLVFSYQNKVGIIKEQNVFYKKGDKICGLMLQTLETTYQKIYPTLAES